MFNFLKKHPTLNSFGFLHTDIHAHWLPGIDDGSPDMETSLGLLRELQDLGYRHLWASPHIMADFYQNTPAIVRDKLAEVRAAAAEAGLELELNAAAEYLLDEGFAAKLAAGDMLTLPGNRLLVELGFVSAPPMLDQLLFQIQTKGYRILLAHPERYLYLKDDFAQYEKLRERGIEFQLNLLSFTGYYGDPIRENAYRLLKAGLADYLGTDLHHERHLARLQAGLEDRAMARALLGHEWKNKELRHV